MPSTQQPLLGRLDERLRDCVGIVAAAVVSAVLLRPFQNTPFVDDWAYAWSVEQLLAGERLELLDFSVHLNVAQVLWGWLFCLGGGFSFVALRCSTFALATIGVCATYLLLRRFEINRQLAILGAALLAVYPPFAILSVTFMTDVPFVSFTILGSYAFVRAVQDRHGGWLLFAVVCSSLAVATRAVGVVMPIAMFATLVVSRNPWGRRASRWAVALVPLVLFAALTYWSRTHVRHVADLTWVANSTSRRLTQLEFVVPLLPRMTVEAVALLIGWLGLALLPLVAGCLALRHARLALAIGVVLGGCLGGLQLLGMRYTLPLAAGATWRIDGLGFTPLLVPHYTGGNPPAVVSYVALAVAVAAVAIAVAHALQRRSFRPGEPFLVWMMLGHAGMMTILWLIHDRYVIVLIPMATALLLIGNRRVHIAPVVVGLVAYAIVSAAGITDHLEYNRALWGAVDALDRAGVPVHDVDAGYIVNGWRQYAHPENAPRGPGGEVNVPWVNGAVDLPYRVGNSVPAGWNARERFPYRRLLGPAGVVYTLERQLESSAAEP